MSYPMRQRERPSRQQSAATAAYTPRANPSHSAPHRAGPTAVRTGYLPVQNTSRPPQHFHPQSHSPGPLPYFLPPPGQPSLDPSLSTPPTTQALRTTYPSRLRTGVTGLVQPETISGGPREREIFLAELERETAVARSGSGTSTPRFHSPAGGRRRGPTTGFTGRKLGRGGTVNYIERESGDENDDDDDDMSDIGEAPSDPEDANYGGERRRRGGWAGTGSMEQQAAMRAGKLRKKRDELERGWTWLGTRVPGDRVRSAITRGTKHIYVSEELLEQEAERPEMLVPISVDLDVPSNNPDQTGIKVKDRFLWNVNETFITPYQFSSIFCEDVGIPTVPYANTIADLISGQVEEAQNAVEIDITDAQVTEDHVVWSDEEVEGEIMALDEEMEKAWDEADCRIIVNLDVQIYSHILRDRIEWDISSSLPPSIFAKHYCSELGLTGEAIPLIAHAIHDELLKHKRDALELELFSLSHPEEQAKWEKTPGGLPRTTNRYGAKPLVGVWREWGEKEEFGPVLVELTMEEMERRELERTREARRMMRTLTASKRRR